MPIANAVIRFAEEHDAAAIAAIYAPNVSEGVASFELIPPDSVEMARRVAATTRDYPWLVCELPGIGVAGYVYASPHNPRAAYQWSVNVTVYVDSRARRAGVGRALYTSLFALLRLQGFYNAYGGITLPNRGSVGIHESFGFELVGIYRQVGYKNGTWWDVGWWGMSLQDKPAGAPGEPLTPAAATTRAGWQDALTKGLALLR